LTTVRPNQSITIPKIEIDQVEEESKNPQTTDSKKKRQKERIETNVEGLQYPQSARKASGSEQLKLTPNTNLLTSTRRGSGRGIDKDESKEK